jgi:hypothetical protein
VVDREAYREKCLENLELFERPWSIEAGPTDLVIPIRDSFLDVPGPPSIPMYPPPSRQYGDFNELLEMPFKGQFDAGDCELSDNFIHAM